METTDSQRQGNDVIHIDDIEQFRARVSGRLSPFRLSASAADPFTSRIWATALHDLEVVQFSTGSDLDVEIPEHLEYFDFVTARCGSALVRSGRHDVEVLPGRTGVILQPGTRVAMRLRSDYDQLHLRITPATFIRSAEQLLGRGVGSKIEFTDGRIDLVHTPSAWSAALAGLADDGLRGLSSGPHALLAHQWADVLVTSILTTLPNTLTPLFDTTVPRVPYRTLGAASDYIESHLSDAMTVAEIASAARVSVRALQRAFIDYYGESPLTFIEQRRLAAVRRDLLDPRPGETVADAAYRWGFTHLSRFAAAYQRKYGERPSATLKTGGVVRRDPHHPTRADR
jgi:AraC-like DNA-binding protein